MYRDPAKLVQLLLDAEPVDAIVGPSGYGISLKHIPEIMDEDLLQIALAKGDDVELPVLTRLVKLLKKLKK
jgi:predicted butyrate kinase (DUF1464 family)